MPPEASGDYRQFLESKRVSVKPSGISIPESEIDPDGHLFPWQKAIVSWALEIGRAAIFADCGLGKTRIQLFWAWCIHKATGGKVLILAPLAVTGQTAEEGAKVGIPVTVCRSQADVRDGINITNYEMLSHFDPAEFIAVVLDESGILKSFMGKIKRQLMEAFASTPYKLCCTATPSPNDTMELGNHADFLNVMPANEMLMRWFINDLAEAGAYRLKRHAESDFWLWVSTWAVSLSTPADIGYPADGYYLPPLTFHTHSLPDPEAVQKLAFDAGKIFEAGSLSATRLHKVTRLTATQRAVRIAELVEAEPDEPWLIWCNTDYEADALKAAIPEAVEIRGATKGKEEKLLAFSHGQIRVLITKPSIAGFGMNWQICARVAYVGLSYSFEQFYQSVRRAWRFGQLRPVEAHICQCESEGDLLRVVQRKQQDHEKMKSAMIEAMDSKVTVAWDRKELLESVPFRAEKSRKASGDAPIWELRQGDCCELVKAIPDNSLRFTLFSPPFWNLYIYSDHEADMGNNKDADDFMRHFQFLASELLRATLPGRLCAIHCKDLPRYKNRDGAMGLIAFPEMLLRVMEAVGWVLHSRVTIWKDPVTEMQRTKSHGLLYKELRANSCASRQGMADFLLVFRKWQGVAEGEDISEPVTHTYEEFPLEQWQQWASPVWFDINQMKTLNHETAKGDKDERHICPLQTQVAERAIRLWSNPGDLVFTPFAGIGTEVYEAVRLGRRGLGFELKPEYFDLAVKHLRDAEAATEQMTIFDEIENSHPAPKLPMPNTPQADTASAPDPANTAWPDEAQAFSDAVSRMDTTGHPLWPDDYQRLANLLLTGKVSDTPLTPSRWQLAIETMEEQWNRKTIADAIARVRCGTPDGRIRGQKEAGNA